jgi:hypothetical protein
MSLKIRETSSGNGDLILKEHGIHMVTATSGIRVRGRWNMALQNEGMNTRSGPSRSLRRDMVVLPPLLLAYVLLFPHSISQQSDYLPSVFT